MPRDSSEVEGQDGGGVQTQTAWPQAGALTRRSARTPALYGYAERKREFCVPDLY